MSAFLDMVSGAGYGSEVGGQGDVGGGDATTGNGGGYFSGLLQTLTTTGTGYLARRIDIDLQRRVAGFQPQVALPTTQAGVGVQRANPPQPGGVAALAGGGTVLGLPPWALLVGVGVLVFALTRKG